MTEPGNITHFFRISGFERDPTGLLTLYTYQGLASTLYVRDDEVWMTGEQGAKIVMRKKGRQGLTLVHSSAQPEPFCCHRFVIETPPKSSHNKCSS